MPKQIDPAKIMLETDTLIIGGGMVGMTLAAALGGLGVRVAVIEATMPDTQLAPEFDGRASAIAAGSRTALETIGVWQHIGAAAQPIEEIRITDGHSPLFLHFNPTMVENVALGHMVENRVLRRALLARLSKLPSVKMFSGRLVSDLRHSSEHVTACLDDGAEIQTPLVVATDGRNSKTRKAAGIGVRDWRYGQTAIVCTVAHERDHQGIAQEHFLPAGPFAILPMTDRRSSIVWTEHEDLAPALLDLDEAAFLDELKIRFGDYLGALEIVGPKFSYPLGLLHAKHYFIPRLALAGDAAHGMHPIAGQGLNMGLRDAAALAEIIADALRTGLDPGTAITLERYEQWRLFDNSLMLAATDGLNRLFSNNLAPVRHARDIGLAAVNQSPGLKRLFMRSAMGVLGELPRLIRGEAL
jgi:2-octaprenyl-6-methoxyphenol hydroxylase